MNGHRPPGWEKDRAERERQMREHIRAHSDTGVNELARRFRVCKKTASRAKREIVGETAMPRKRPLPSIAVPVLKPKRDRKPGTRPVRTLVYEADGEIYRLDCCDLPPGGRFVALMLPPLAEV